MAPDFAPPIWRGSFFGYAAGYIDHHANPGVAMADKNALQFNFTDADLPDRVTVADIEANRFTEATLERHKREGLELAVRTRWIALGIIAVMLPFLNPNWEMLYYEVLLLALALVGWLQRRVGRVGRSGTELAVMFLDLALVTVVLVVPNPFAAIDWPSAMGYRFQNFIYFFVILAGGTLAYSWRTISAIGTWTAVMWMIGVAAIWYFGKTSPELGAAAQQAFGHDPRLLELMDPNSLGFDIRVQEVVVFVIVSVTLAVSARRFNRLLLGNAALERERANLSRYFSPNVVDELSNNDEPLKQIRTHDVAVLFVDIIGFTSYAATRDPQEVIETLRCFHGRMETEVFRHNGTLDKYLGDGLMATFGTPFAGDRDATNAMECLQAMRQSLEDYNLQRAAANEPQIKASFGLHYGPVVLGDIGANRLEFAVIGNTVNIAARLEQLTRDLSVSAAISDALQQQVAREGGASPACPSGLTRVDDQAIRGAPTAMTVWTAV